MSEADPRETTFLQQLGQSVRQTRAVRGMSRKVLSQTSGLSERYIAQLESGQGNVSILLLRRVAAAMGARLDDLIPGSEAPADWAVVRDLLGHASDEQIARVKAILAGVALIGLRGAGKSTLGQFAADKLGCRFVELDREIEREAGLSMAEIFALYGQEGYRRLEQAQVRRFTGAREPLLLATGGGIVAEPLTFDLVLSSFFTVWLKATPEDHMQRVRDQGDLRPMGEDRSAMQELRAILLSREPLYARAHAVLETSGLDVTQAGETLVHTVRQHVAAAA